MEEICELSKARLGRASTHTTKKKKKNMIFLAGLDGLMDACMMDGWNEMMDAFLLLGFSGCFRLRKLLWKSCECF